MADAGRARLLAALRGAPYLAAAAAVAAFGCGRPAALVPAVPFVPVSVDSLRAVASRTLPAAPVAYFFRWRVEGSAEMSGRGAARLVPPDSLRLDVGVPVLGRATVVLAGDSSWAAPASVAERLLPGSDIGAGGGEAGAEARAMLWAMFGVVRPPEGGVAVEVADAPPRRSFRLTEPGGLVTQLDFAGDTLLAATRWRAGKQIGELAVTRDGRGALARVVAVDREEEARFVMSVDRREGGPFPSEIWRRP